MNSKLCLILFGALVAIAALSAAENSEEKSLSEEVAISRVARAANADPGKSKKKSRKFKKNKASKKRNKSKRKTKKASKKARKSKRKSKSASKKGKKSNRNNKKASKKNKKSKKSKNRKARKNKKAKKSRKNKKSGKNQKSRKNKKTRKNQKNRQGESTVPGTCVTTAVNSLYNGLSKKASNFDRQSKRIEARLPKIANKLAKASEYNATMDDLIAANASSGGCPAGDQTVVTALIATLGECQTNIETACAEPMYNQTQIDECKPIVEGFVAEVEKCFGLNSDATAACECWESDALAELETGLKGCVIKPSEANVTDAFKACKTAVSTCNKAQVEAIPALVNCTQTEADLVAEAETVANNIAALDSAKAAIEAVASSTRNAKAAAETCADLLALVDARKFSKQNLSFTNLTLLHFSPC